MQRILKLGSRIGNGSTLTENKRAGGQTGVRQVDSAASRRGSASRPATDILSHLQALKDQERQVLRRGIRDAAPSATNASAEEIKSRQERQAREEKLASMYREQLKTRLQEINSTAIDLGQQKATMASFERQMVESVSAMELEQLELERVNGVRALIGLPALARPVALSGGVRQSRPGTPQYTGSSPSNLPSPHPYHSHSKTQYSHHHRRSSSFGDGLAADGGHVRRPVVSGQQKHSAYTPSRDNPRYGQHVQGQARGRSYSRGRDSSMGRSRSRSRGRETADHDSSVDNEVQDMDLGCDEDMEDGELAE
ncbi:hypothetical protein IW150_002066 [Coemansia sp. RSA 2607]|nr:hypothetical protein IW150_002066 [Coemansia sp. RSA 2607]